MLRQHPQTCIIDAKKTIVFVDQIWREVVGISEGANYLHLCEQLGIPSEELHLPLNELFSGQRDSFDIEYQPPSAKEGSGVHTARFIRIPDEFLTEPLVLATHQEEIRTLVTKTRCIFWSGTVMELSNGSLRWDVHIDHEGTAQELLPIPIEERARSDAYGTAKIRAGESYSQTFRIRLKNGDLLWVKDDVTVEPVREGLWNIIGSTTDITALKGMEEDFTHLMAQAQCLLWHARIEEVGGELLWQSVVRSDTIVSDFLPIAQKEGQSYADAWIASRIQEEWEPLHLIASTAIHKGEDYSLEYRCRLADGNIIWIKEDVQVEVLAPGHWNAVGVCTDITERKRQEESIKAQEQHFRLALEGGDLGSWHVDAAAGRFIHVSDSLKRLFGRPLEQEFLWDDFINSILMEDRGRVFAVIASALANNQKESVEFRATLPDGSVHWFSAHGQGIPDLSGKITQIIGVTRDITEQKYLEQRRLAALQEAHERADRDPLTNLYNHRAFHKRLEEECARARRDGTTLAVVMLDLDNFKFFNDFYGHTVGDQVLLQVTQRLRETCRIYDTLSRFGGDEFALILPNVGATVVPEIEARLKSELKFSFHPEGYPNPIPITISLGISLYPKENESWHDSIRQADERLLRAKTGGSTEREADQARAHMSETVEGFSMLDALVTAVDNKDRYTTRHSEDVMHYSLQLARALHATDEQQQTIAAAALLHDVGKIGVPDSILRKPGKLSDEEFATIQLHPTMGAAIVGAVAGLEGTLDAVRYHHERWDGKGYPKGLAQDKIPWTARLMAVADAYSAMTTDRPYRQGMPPERARAILAEGAGTQWDPTMVALFLEHK